MSRRRAYFFVPLFIAACAVVAAIAGGSRVAAATPPEDVASQSLKSFTTVYDAVERNFADPVQPDRAIYDGAIPGMLDTLDPHSHFLDPKENSAQREQMSERYYGTGMTISQKGKKIIVLYPFEGSPAAKAGLRPGDVILQVAGKKADGMDTSQIADLLRGTRGSNVRVLVSREGVPSPITYDIVRGEIPRPSVPYAMFVKPGIAYVEITAFQEHTAQEMEDKIRQLGEKNIHGLILDLRSNGGGLVDEGVDVAGHFLKKGQLVVSHHGRNSAPKNYVARVDGTGDSYPVVVLVNRSTASAAEIVTGALQDHDRAWILGEPTFGKGLVQSVFQLSGNTALWLATAHFYTPSGRLIQRDYSHISFLDYFNHANLDQKNTADVKMTDSGRTVYGGGGITPDERFTCIAVAMLEAPFCTSADKTLNKFQIEVLRTDSLFGFASSYFGPKTNVALPKDWTPGDDLIAQFKDYLTKNKAEFTDAQFTQNLDWVKRELKRQMYVTAFSYEDSQQIAIEQDPEVAKAIDAMPSAQALLDNAKKLLVERITGQEPQLR